MVSLYRRRCLRASNKLSCLLSSSSSAYSRYSAMILLPLLSSFSFQAISSDVYFHRKKRERDCWGIIKSWRITHVIEGMNVLFIHILLWKLMLKYFIARLKEENNSLKYICSMISDGKFSATTLKEIVFPFQMSRWWCAQYKR